MKRMISLVCTFFVTATMLFSCAEDATQTTMDANASPATRVDNPKKVMVYVETNDINPLNVLCYVKPDGKPFVDILNIFAANINADNGNRPSIHFNQELAPIMNNYITDIKPIQDAGIKVNLTLLGNWANVGVANLVNPTEFARLVAYVVYTYGFDGIAIDDEYAGYGNPRTGTCGAFIDALRAEFNNRGGDKMITLFQWNNYDTGHIIASQGAKLDYVDHGLFGNNTFGSCGVAGVPNSKFMPVAINLGNPMPSTYNTTQLNQILANATRVVSQGYAGFMGFNLRDNCSALPVFQRWAQAMGTSVTCGGCNYPQRTPFIPGGHTITNADVPTNF